MFTIGAHISAAKGFKQIGKDTLSIGGSTFQFFSRNPRGTKAKEINMTDAEALQAIMQSRQFGKVIAHAPYTMNACAKDPHLRELSAQMFREDLERMELFPGNYYNFHPGSHSGQGIETGIEQIAELLNKVLWKEQRTIVLLETMAGKGSEIGRRFEELQQIIERVEHKELLGVCFDACHLHDAGYNIVHNLDVVLEQFDNAIGLQRLKAFHLNDSKNTFGSRKDRHEKIGQGQIGLAAIVRLINHPALRDLPFILETPCTLEEHGEEIALLKSHRKKAEEVQN